MSKMDNLAFSYTFVMVTDTDYSNHVILIQLSLDMKDATVLSSLNMPAVLVINSHITGSQFE